MTLITKSLLWLYLVDPGVDSTIDKKINKRKKKSSSMCRKSVEQNSSKNRFHHFVSFYTQKNKINRKHLTEI